MYIMEISLLWMQNAESKLNSSKLLFDKGFSSSIIDIIYFAMFSSIKALLLKRSIECKTHEGLLYLFKINYVDKGLFSRHLFKEFCRCKELKTSYFNLSQIGVPREVIWKYLNCARDFVDDSWELM